MFWQVIAHLLGDYFLQSDWMAAEKTKKNAAALAHVATYVLPFLFLTRSLPALAVIVGTHFVIDRWRLARYVCWAKNWLAPKWIVRGGEEIKRSSPDEATTYTPVTKIRNYPWSECVGTGYHATEKPLFLTLWLMIITDNTMHVICNALALRWL